MSEEQFTKLITLGHSLSSSIAWIGWGLIAIGFSLLQDNFKSKSIITTECPNCKLNNKKGQSR